MSRTRRTSRTKPGFAGEICKIGGVPWYGWYGLDCKRPASHMIYGRLLCCGELAEGRLDMELAVSLPMVVGKIQFGPDSAG